MHLKSRGLTTFGATLTSVLRPSISPPAFTPGRLDGTRGQEVVRSDYLTLCTSLLSRLRFRLATRVNRPIFLQKERRPDIPVWRVGENSSNDSEPDPRRESAIHGAIKHSSI